MQQPQGVENGEIITKDANNDQIIDNKKYELKIAQEDEKKSEEICQNKIYPIVINDEPVRVIPANLFIIDDFSDFDVEIDGEKWTTLLKAAGTDLIFSSSLWTNEKLLNAEAKDLQTFTGSSSKFIGFCKKPIQELLIISKNGFKTRLMLPENKPLLEFFKDDKPTILKYVSGEADPVALACGQKSLFFEEPIWRINSVREKYDFKCRFGGYYHNISHKCHAIDKNDSRISAEMAGFGIEDNAWFPLTYNKKSFGIRAAGDQTGFGQAQLISEAIIYGK